MKALPILAFTLTLGACGYAYGDPVFWTVSGNPVYLSSRAPVEREHVDALLTYQAGRASNYFDTDVLALYAARGENLKIVFTDECLGGCREDGTPNWAGVFNTQEIKIYWPHNWHCAAASALGHELTHAAHYLAVEGWDTGHMTPGLWIGPESVAGSSVQYGYHTLCGY